MGLWHRQTETNKKRVVRVVCSPKNTPTRRSQADLPFLTPSLPSFCHSTRKTFLTTRASHSGRNAWGSGHKQEKKRSEIWKKYIQEILNYYFVLPFWKWLMHVKQLIKAYPEAVGLFNGVCLTMVLELLKCKFNWLVAALCLFYY